MLSVTGRWAAVLICGSLPTTAERALAQDINLSFSFRTYKGAISDISPKGFSLATTSNGTLRVGVDNQTSLSVRTRQDLTVLPVGGIVMITGTAKDNHTVESSSLVYISSGKVTPQLAAGWLPESRIKNGLFTTTAASADAIPVVVVGKIESTSPLVVRGMSTVRNMYALRSGAGKGAPRPMTYLVTGKAINVTVSTPAGGTAQIDVELEDIRLVGNDPQAEVDLFDLSIGDLQNPIKIYSAERVRIIRTEPFDLADLKGPAKPGAAK